MFRRMHLQRSISCSYGDGHCSLLQHGLWRVRRRLNNDCPNRYRISAFHVLLFHQDSPGLDEESRSDIPVLIALFVSNVLGKNQIPKPNFNFEEEFLIVRKSIVFYLCSISQFSLFDGYELKSSFVQVTSKG